MQQTRFGQEQALKTAGLAADVMGAGEQRQMQREQFDRSISLEGAKAGYEEVPPGEQEAPPQGPQARQGVPASQQPFPQQGEEEEAQGSRSSQLEQEMARGEQQGSLGPLEPQQQQNLTEQGGKKMEMDAHGRWRMTPEAKQAQARDARRKD